MNVFHVTLFFSYGTAYSWVEQFYRYASGHASALAAAKALAQARYSILGQGASLYRVRVSQVGLSRSVASAPIQGTTLTQPAMLPIEGMDVRLQTNSTPAHWRNFCLRGIPSAGVMQQGARWTWSPLLQTAGPAWLSLLISQQWLLSVELPLGRPLPIQSIAPITSLISGGFGDPLEPAEPPPGPGLLTALSASPPPPGGTIVKIQGVQPNPDTARERRAINGTYQIAATWGNAVVYMGNIGVATAMAVGGTMQVCQKAFLPIATASLVRRVGRKCGPFKESGETPSPLPQQPSTPGTLTRRLAAPYFGANLLVASAAIDAGRPQPAPTPPPYGPGSQITTLFDVLKFIKFYLSKDVPPSEYEPIGVSKILTVENSYAITCAGTFFGAPGSETGTNLLAAITLALTANSAWVQAIMGAVVSSCAPGSTLYFFGVSQGGMANEVAAYYLYRAGWKIGGLVQFESPPMFLQTDQPYPYWRSLLAGDLVTTVTPLGISYSLALYPGYTLVPNTAENPFFPNNHLGVYTNQNFAAFNWLPWWQTYAPGIWTSPVTFPVPPN